MYTRATAAVLCCALAGPAAADSDTPVVESREWILPADPVGDWYDPDNWSNGVLICRPETTEANCVVSGMGSREEPRSAMRETIARIVEVREATYETGGDGRRGRLRLGTTGGDRTEQGSGSSLIGGVPIPEPTAYMLLAGGSGFILGRTRRRD